jgi:glycosyltransferase involved in cell wall biosynthesis
VTSISVVTPTFNRADYICTAVESAASQSYAALEHIVVDGQSRDDTVERLKRYPHLQVICEPDRGLYDAINKGIRASRGDVICLLNSDDALLAGAFEAVARAFEIEPEADSVCGRIRLAPVGGQGREIEVGTPAMQKLREQDIISGLPLTNARFFRRSVFDSLGFFEQDFPLLADRDFLARVYLAEIRTAAIDRPVYRYGIHAGSLTFGSDIMPTSYLAEAVRLASRRLEESDGPRERSFYRQWLDWLTGYRAVRSLTRGDLGQLKSLSTASEVRGFSPLAFSRQFLRHVATRAERRGRVVVR